MVRNMGRERSRANYVGSLYEHLGSGGRCEIRTHEDLATLPVFKTGAFNRSANLPCLEL